MYENTHSCKRCGYNTTHLITFKRHLGRKNICKNILSDNDLMDDYIKYNITEKIKNPVINCKSTVSQPKVHNNPHLYTQPIPDKYPENSEKSENLNKCEYCKKVLSSYKNLWRHLKTCKEKEKQEKQKKLENEARQSMSELVKLLNEQLKQKDIELEKRDKQIDELIKKAGINNSNITQNIQNNIKLLPYKDTDLSTLREKDIIKCLNHSNMCVPQLIKMIHLNPKKPENHNIYISNLKNGYIMVYNGANWDTLNRDDIIDEMINDKECLIQDKIEDWIETGVQYPTIMRKFERYLEKKEKNKVLNKIKEEIRLMLYNNKNLVINEK